MTEIADRFRRRAQLLTDTVAAVPEDRWGSPSPCEEWTARDVVQHVIDTQGLFAGFVGRELEPGPSIDDDPTGAWEAARDQTQAALDDPDLASAAYEGMFGSSTFEKGVDQFLSLDLIVHRWDLARAAGVDDAIPEEDLDALEAAMAAMDEQMGEAMRSPGAFGPALDAPEGSDRQTQVLAFAGRKAW